MLILTVSRITSNRRCLNGKQTFLPQGMTRADIYILAYIGTYRIIFFGAIPKLLISFPLKLLSLTTAGNSHLCISQM